MIINKLKYLLALLSVSVTAMMAMSQETPTIKIVDFRVDETIDRATMNTLARDYAYQSTNGGKKSWLWALLIIESNVDDGSSLQFTTGAASEYAEKFKCDASYWYDELSGKWRTPSQEEKDKVRDKMKSVKLNGEKWISINPGVFTRIKISTGQGNNAMRLKNNEPEIRNDKGEIIGHIEDGYFIANSSIARQFELGKTYRLIIDVPQYNPRPVEEKKQEMGWIVIDSDPQGAKVFSVKDGVETLMDMPTPYTVKVPYGTYFYRISKNLYHDENIEVVVNQAKVSEMVKLRPDFGSINITSTPAGAEVSIDNYRLSQTYTTPCRIDNVPSGTYTLTLMKAAHTPYVQTVTVSGGEVTQVNAALDSRLARITINSLPGAAITINGENKGTTSFSGDLVANTYDIEATLAGHEKATKQITVVAKQPQTIELKPTPMYGTLDIMSAPYNASVSVDGKVAGTTPLTLDKLLVGTHTVKITLDGYEEVTKTVTIAKDSEETLSLQLTKIVAPSVASPVSSGYNQVATASGLTPRWSSSATAEQRRIIGELIESMVMVEGGTFTMGATSEQGGDAYDWEKPTHRVTLSDYYIGKYEVTQEQWQAVMGSNPSSYKGSRKPVESVSWNDCQEFVRKLQALTGLKFELPTEAQWEYAARGGNKSRGYKYSGSNNLSSVAWYWDNSSDGTKEVGQKAPNELGLYDMSGNVWEWCQDWYGSYSDSPQTNPTGSSTGSNRVLRGGSWLNYAGYCRVSRRYDYVPGYRYFLNGLRLALQF